MSLKKIIDVKSVNTLLKKGIINKEGVRIIDCSFAVAPRPDWKEFEQEGYGDFKNLMAEPSPSRNLYLAGHIPEAVHVDLDIATYPSRYQRFQQYRADLFEEYAQMVGLNNKEHFIFYGKGAFGGMLFASKVAWIFKSYGHENISLVDGGFDSWKRNGFEVSTELVKLPAGNFKAEDNFKKYVITFQELEAKKDGEDKQFIEKTSEINFLDSRIRGQFDGTQETGLDPHLVNGTRIAGFKNLPSAELLVKGGNLKSEEEIKSWLTQNGYVENQPTITSCNAGIQAALLAYVIDAVKPSQNPPRVYNGSLKEMELRAPKKISEGPQHLPH
ncbi:Putative thiosulfate sulfurtransferase mpst-1 [Caenorhabditis elegans]|uniref:Putative thiosulfate sulfurtransferase mpst-1 n=1 Tax=Caenorhabditis elegans TaxID=6239 RepID=THT2_CAEEL|nr:Putative thiosulfate sulfurtransferase mpst-1 [Caenorhabditis elegans]O17730.1 RecName: Full=Putative thiosulfate sulfurtransferase mpst-1; AltName: Full=Mercaptopyruvate sulfurtransferase homolog 1 [Caenorhabditis elegans]CAB02870.1 Putative thiosulfate sulfurtransferase mpst-1 [Caenorhabditis elegans]|eukprot:NP_505979.1 Putative thiosulfate sulfurtransferase mpst-1 [Caenorhabditis elegans]